MSAPALPVHSPAPWCVWRCRCQTSIKAALWSCLSLFIICTPLTSAFFLSVLVALGLLWAFATRKYLTRLSVTLLLSCRIKRISWSQSGSLLHDSTDGSTVIPRCQNGLSGVCVVKPAGLIKFFDSSQMIWSFPCHWDDAASVPLLALPPLCCCILSSARNNGLVALLAGSLPSPGSFRWSGCGHLLLPEGSGFPCPSSGSG